MKFSSLAASIFLLSTTTRTPLASAAGGETFYSGSDLAGIDSYDEASSLCTDSGTILATEAEWCTYAQQNPRTVYGVAPLLNSESCIDVEMACGIPTHRPARPSILRTRGKVGTSTSTTTSSNSGGVVTRTRARAPSTRKLEECRTLKSVLCMPDPTPRQDPPPSDNNKGSSSGDPHFRTWTGDKFDYHGECDLVLVDNPSFNEGQGLRVHIRTTRIKYFSFIERIAIQIGADILEFNNDVENFYINGSKVEAQKKHHKTMLGGFWVRRDPMAISIRIAEGTGLHQKTGAAKIDLHTRKNGFPAVIVDGGNSDVFKGSLGLLGEWGTGKKLARDGSSELTDATEFALEWQVGRSSNDGAEPMLFMEPRFPQYPTTCTPPEAMPRSNGLGASLEMKEAEEACAHWEDDKDDCIFDVIAVGDTSVAKEGHIAQVA